LFNKTIALYQGTTIVEQIGHGLVELIESGAIDSPEMDKLLHSYITPMIEKNIDFLVLGCSHYPYLIPKIKKILPEHIQIIDSGEAVARQTQVVLKDKIGISSIQKSTAVFYTNGNPKVLYEILENKYTVVKKDF
jgi:glutamate racemase